LGWSPGGDREIMTIPEMVDLFSPDGLQKKAAIFDPKKLEWMNGQHLSLMPLEKLEPRVTPSLIAAGLTTPEQLAGKKDWYLSLLDLLRVRARTIDDIVRQARPYFSDQIDYDPEAVQKHWSDTSGTIDVLRAIRAALADAPWTAESLEAVLRDLAAAKGVAAGKLFQPLRVALTGLTVSPGIFELLLAMGRERTLRRLDRAVEYLQAAAG
jgi:glutamyl-tRNA synthetase